MTETSTSEHPRKLRALINSVRDSFENPGDWSTTRRLKRPDNEAWSTRNEGYLDILPRFDDRDFIAHLVDKINDQGSASLLDIGTGAGIALLDLRKKFPDPSKLRIVGLGNRKEIQEWARDIPRGVFVLNPEQELESANIEFIHANFPDAYKTLKQDSFDVITAVYSLDWINYPSYSLVKKVWRLLKHNGIAFIGPFEFHLKNKSGHLIKGSDYLKSEYGLNFQTYPGAVSFKKTQRTLPDIFSHSSGNIPVRRAFDNFSHI